MKCAYCKDPIYNFQKFRIRMGKEGNKRYYHDGCYEKVLDKLIDKTKRRLTLMQHNK